MLLLFVYQKSKKKTAVPWYMVKHLIKSLWSLKKVQSNFLKYLPLWPGPFLDLKIWAGPLCIEQGTSSFSELQAAWFYNINKVKVSGPSLKSKNEQVHYAEVE